MSKPHASKTQRSFFTEIEQERQRKIAKTAYYIAEKRGFRGDAESQVQDWLMAEREIDALLMETV